MTRRALAAAGVLAGVVALALPSFPAEQEVAGDGTVHRVRVETWQSGGKSGASVLRHVIEKPDGAVSSGWVTGTDDPAIDREPALDLDPVTNAPILAWTRVSGSGNGFDLFLSRFEDGAWSAPRLLFSSFGEERGPKIAADERFVHVVWFSDTPVGDQLLRLTLDRSTLAEVFGPEVLPTGDEPLAPASAATEPPKENEYFASEVPPLPGESGGRLVVHGIRDAPDPVDYVMTFGVPGGLRDLRRCWAGWLARHFVVHFDVGERFYYLVWETDGWSDMRSIPLGDGLTASDARSQLVESFRRATSSQPN